MIEGSGSGSIPLTNGSGSGSRRPKNIRIRRIRIRTRTRNTARKMGISVPRINQINNRTRYTTESSKFVPGLHNFFTFSQKQLRGSASRRMRILMRIRIRRITLMRTRIQIFYLMRIRFRLFTLMRIRIRIQILVFKKKI
jgi:hypothetical protein